MVKKKVVFEGDCVDIEIDSEEHKIMIVEKPTCPREKKSSLDELAKAMLDPKMEIVYRKKIELLEEEEEARKR